MNDVPKKLVVIEIDEDGDQPIFMVESKLIGTAREMSVGICGESSTVDGALKATKEMIDKWLDMDKIK